MKVSHPIQREVSLSLDLLEGTSSVVLDSLLVLQVLQILDVLHSPKSISNTVTASSYSTSIQSSHDNRFS